MPKLWLKPTIAIYGEGTKEKLLIKYVFTYQSPILAKRTQLAAFPLTTGHKSCKAGAIMPVCR